MSKVIDLDILRPDSKLIKLGGKEIDVSFIPCGITFELDSIVQQLLKVLLLLVLNIMDLLHLKEKQVLLEKQCIHYLMGNVWIFVQENLFLVLK